MSSVFKVIFLASFSITEVSITISGRLNEILIASKIVFTLFKMGMGGRGGGAKKAGIRPQNFLTFSFNPLATLV